MGSIPPRVCLSILTRLASYAVQVSFANLGVAAAKLFGLLCIQSFEIHADIDGTISSCNFDYYLPLLVCTRVIVPFLGLTLTYLLLPPVYERTHIK